MVVLAEDKRHQRLARRYLYLLGYRTDQVRFRPVPNSRGCGEQWVRENYRGEVAECRTRQGRAATALLVIVDADIGSVEARAAQLAAALDPKHRQDGEPIAHLIPKRNIETWVLCLSGKAVDEEADYRRDPNIDNRLSEAATVFHSWTRPNADVPGHCVDSVRRAISEAHRIPARNP